MNDPMAAVDPSEDAFWKRKLLAYLHDPPEKALDVPGHTKRRETYVRYAVGEPADLLWFFDRVCDHTAAAADRFCFPKYPHGAAEFDPAAGAPFHHPLGAQDPDAGKLICKCPSADTASGIFEKAQKRLGLDGKSFEDKFWLHWRFWREEASAGAGGDKHPALAYLPADTRIPDHTIWTHAAITSALQACVEIEEDGDGGKVKEFRPAFLLMQFGPVQDFIAQARTTRDLWSGSYLLSWIVAHAIKAVTDRIGPDAVLFPALCGQPLFDFLNRDRFERMGRWTEIREGANVPLHTDEQVLTPNLPNRFLAVVPESLARDLASAAETAAQSALIKIGNECWKWLIEEHPEKSPGEIAARRWDQQLRQFLTVTWQVVGWKSETTEASIRRFGDRPGGQHSGPDAACSPAEALRRAHAAALDGIPDNLKDPRNYSHTTRREATGWKSEIIKENDRAMIDNPAFAWASHYAEAEFLLAARRNVREFSPWGQWEDGRPIDLPERLGTVKDALSGKEEVIGSEDWQKGLHSIFRGRFFRSGERLGAMNLIKRIWHEAVLRPMRLRRTPRFDSVPAVAAAHWVTQSVDQMGQRPEAWTALLDLQEFLDKSRDELPIRIPGAARESDWLRQVDASIYHVGEWDRMEDISRETREEARRLLRRLHKECGAQPPRYIAVLAMDGDSMGSWVSGAMSPPWNTQLASQAVSTFFLNQDIRGFEERQKLLESPRHVSPSYHLQFSEALANFSVFLAGSVVGCFDGQLIYSGGDDVIAMLPARQALLCANGLRRAFRGETDLRDHFPGAQALHRSHQGFVGLDGSSDVFRRTRRFVPRGVPLIVPGTRADISAGIAIGHMHTPLQNLVRAAHSALERAKKSPGKASFSMSLLKRSGEAIKWGARWDSHAVEIFEQFSKLSDQGRLSGKFPYALAGLLRPYASNAASQEWTIARVNGFDPMEIFPLEIQHVLNRQSDRGWRKSSERVEFEKLVLSCLQDCRGRPLDDFLGPFLASAFIHRNVD